MSPPTLDEKTQARLVAMLDRMHLDHVLGQIDPYADSMTSCNLLHGLPPSQASD